MKKRKKDIIILAVILCLTLAALGINYFLFSDQGKIYCEIYVDGKLTKAVSLAEDRKFSVKERPQIVFEIKNHSIAFLESDCPDKLCVHSGYLSHNGQSSTCLPNKTTIRIRSEDVKADDPELVAYIDISDFDWRD